MAKSTQALIAQQHNLVKRLVDAATAEGALLTAVAEGNAYAAGAKIAASGGDGAVLLRNPANSNTMLTIFKFTLSSDMTVDMWFVRDAGLLAGSSVNKPFNLNWASPNTAKANMHSGVGILDGGETLSPVLNLPADTNYEMQLPLIIPPGSSAAIMMSIGSHPNADFYSSMFWYETAL